MTTAAGVEGQKGKQQWRHINVWGRPPINNNKLLLNRRRMNPVCGISNDFFIYGQRSSDIAGRHHRTKLVIVRHSQEAVQSSELSIQLTCLTLPMLGAVDINATVNSYIYVHIQYIIVYCARYEFYSSSRPLTSAKIACWLTNWPLKAICWAM